jgi:glyoxylase-like metal-dependent hydrolase (beta-lactamase superfamily II)/ADP-ribose pyrophosphatase YjhB (NUDIX family)|tara:strand:- start:186 stop:1727 length:1542 start_codon:yes stop_codon:yes gene_type:complete
MSELPEGVELPSVSVAIPRPSASLIISRINAGREEILLCHRVSEVPAFPDFWAFPGGGVSRVDKKVAKENPDWFAHTDDSILTITLLRELVEEVGFSPNGKGSLELVDEEIQEEVCNDKNAWGDLVKKGLLKIENFNSQIIAERTMPPLAPLRFTNTFHHLSIKDSTIQPRFPKGMTEFDEYKWWEPKTLLDTWLRHEVRLPPPQVTLVRNITQAIEDYGGLDLAFQKISENPSKGYHILEFAPGVECVPLPTQTLPPATHTNCYVLGIAGGDRVIIDPAAKSEEALDILSKKVKEIELTGSKIIATIFTHKHPDHIGNLMRISEIYQAPIWASKETLEIIPKCETDKILKEGDIFELNYEDVPVYWEIMETHGHCPGHICLAGDAGIVSGDNVAVIGTILVPSSDGDMNQYLDGLERIKNLNPPLLFPGHGPFSANPQRLLNRYINHRSKRHQAVYDAVKSNYGKLELIAEKAYEDTPDAHPILLVDQTLSHLKGHIKSGKVKKINNEYFVK